MFCCFVFLEYLYVYLVCKYGPISVRMGLKLVVIIFPSLQSVEMIGLVYHCSIHLVMV